MLIWVAYGMSVSLSRKYVRLSFSSEAAFSYVVPGEAFNSESERRDDRPWGLNVLDKYSA